MEEAKEIKTMLKEHIESSNEWREKVIVQLAKIDTHSEYTKKTLTEHKEDIGVLKATRSKQNGALWAFGIIWTAILALIGLSKHH